MPLYDYRCPSTGHVQEQLQPMWAELIFCPQCQEEAQRVAANRVAVTTPEVDMRGKFRRYEEASQEQEHLSMKVEQSTGQAPAAPPLWRMAKQRANQMLARGEAPPMHKEQMQ